MVFDSKAEARRYRELLQLERAGVISKLTLQPGFSLSCGGQPVLLKSKRYPNGRRVTYRADFSYRESGAMIVEDVKGRDTRLSALKRAVLEAETGIKVRLVEY